MKCMQEEKVGNFLIGVFEKMRGKMDKEFDIRMRLDENDEELAPNNYFVREFNYRRLLGYWDVVLCLGEGTEIGFSEELLDAIYAKLKKFKFND
jgi:hypothetical protein